jgi:hypothetical protein
LQPLESLAIDCDHIESTLGPVLVSKMATQPPLRRQNHPTLFGAPDAGGGTAPVGPAALADFYEDHAFAVAQNQVNLTAPPADIARDQL